MMMHGPANVKIGGFPLKVSTSWQSYKFTLLGLYVESDCLPSMQKESKYKCISLNKNLSAFINQIRASHVF
jgi:hypothetical protein